MFPGAFKRRWTLRWSVGRILTALVIGVVIAASNKVFGQEVQYEYRYALSETGIGGRWSLDEGEACQTVAPYLPQIARERGLPGFSNGEVEWGNQCYQYAHDSAGTRLLLGPKHKALRFTRIVEEQECEADREISADLPVGPSSIADDGSIAIPDTYTDAQGCEWVRFGISACTVGVREDGQPGSQCAVNYRSTGEKGSTEDGPEPQADEDFEVADADTVSSPVEENETVAAPETIEFSDGSSKTTDETVRSWLGGGSATVKEAASGNGWTLSVIENSSTIETVRTTTTHGADGSSTTVKTTTTAYKNGHAATAGVNRSGSSSGAVTFGDTGTTTTTTTTVRGSDGSITSKTTTTGNGTGNANCGPQGCSGSDAPDAPDGGDDSGNGGDGEGDGQGEGDGLPGTYSGDGAPTLEEVRSFGDSFSALYAGIRDAPIMSPLSNISAGAAVGGQCPTANFTAFETEFTIDAHCTIWENAKPVLSPIFLALWTLVGIRIFFSA